MYYDVSADKLYQLADWRLRPLPDEMVNTPHRHPFPPLHLRRPSQRPPRPRPPAFRLSHPESRRVPNGTRRLRSRGTVPLSRDSAPRIRS
ncbi:hypothetical protein EI94DRAFT_1753469 [Lactarius quietus]|nr:hypothetical protein EI94DRAFT_1753469 [Lactarius quietus]